MSQLAGILGKDDLTALTRIEPEPLTEAVNLLLQRYQAERDAAFGFFVEAETDQFKTTYLLGGVDEGQETGPDGRPLETRAGGKIEVAFPWKRIKWALGWNYEIFARMTVGDLDRHTNSKVAGNAKRHMREIFRALFARDNYTHVDEDGHGSLTIRRLANNDGTLYPPTVTGDVEITDDHYVVAGYAASAMSATNNPLELAANEVREHFATTQAVAVLVNSAQRKQILTLLPNFVDAPTVGVTQGSNTATAEALADANVPGDFLGIDGDSGVWVYVYDRVPADYMYGAAVGVPAPLYRRVPEVTDLRGFVVEAEERHNPFFKRSWVDRFGYAVGNRLNGVVIQLTAPGAYVTPAIYA